MARSIAIKDEALTNKIYWVRGHKIMLDRDLAEIYNVKPIRLREQVKRNRGRFPEGFMFRLKKKEIDDMVSQNAIPSIQHLGGFSPLAFTEHGVLMLANILKSKRALAMSIRIIEIFVRLRQVLLMNKEILLKLERLERKTDKHEIDIKVIFRYLKELLNPKFEPLKRIGFKRRDEQ